MPINYIPQIKENVLLPITGKETCILITKSICVILLLNYLFYRSWWALLPLSVIGLQYFKTERKQLLKLKKAIAKEQFKEMLLLTATGQKAGYSVENAFLSSYVDLERLYGSDSSICQMLKLLQIGKENRVPFSQIWKYIGKQADISEIQEFSQVYEIANDSSGNMSSVMEKTAAILIQKLEIEKEISVMLSGKKLEQKIMNAMPFTIMLYISITSPGYFDGMYHTFLGVLIMSIALAIYIIAYTLSLKISSFEI